jgi:hypothetical protein
MEVLIALIIFIIIVLCISILWGINNNGQNIQKENMFVKARAYYSCPSSINCAKDAPKISGNDLITINPFIWPYSGTYAPQSLIRQEHDHEVAQ